MQFMEITVFEVWRGWGLKEKEKRTGVGGPDIRLALTIGKQANHQTCLMEALPM